MKPTYLHIAHELRERIVAGELAPGAQVPSTRDLQSDYGVASATATKALRVLVDEGLCESKVGVGTTVLAQAPIYRHAEGRLRAQRTTGKFQSAGETSVITESAITNNVPPAVRADLELNADEPAIRRHRVTSRDGTPVEVSTSWFSAALATDAPLLVGRGRIEGGTTAYICRQLGKNVTHGLERLSVRMATAEEAESLRKDTPLPVLVTEHVASINDDPICHEVGICPPGYRTIRTYELN